MDIKDLRRVAEAFVAAESSEHQTGGWWKPPLLATATIDRRFDILQRAAAPDHLRPTDLLSTARSLIVFFIPFVNGLVKENRPGERPCRNWGVAYVDTNLLIAQLSQVLADALAEPGFKSALTPATHNFDEVRLMARWSHKHLAYLAGLGRFGVHHLLITPQGCAGRLGSLVTEADLGDHPLMDGDEACLLKAGQKCGKCMEGCPISALSGEGIERRKCWERLKENRATLPYLEDLPESTHVCGKCAALMPCSFKNPVAALVKEKATP